MLKVKKDRVAAASSERTTAHYVDRMQREGRPITLSIDGRPPLVVKDERAYQLLWELVDRIETIEAVREALAQMEGGEGRPAEDVFEDMRKKHRIPRAK
jgi:hypothetical protein